MLYLFEGFELSAQEFSLSIDGKRVSLEPQVLRVLLALVENRGQLLEKRVLIDMVWRDTSVEETALTRAVALIRKQLSDDSRSPRFIETVPTRGYRFIAQVESRPEPKLPPGLPRPSSSPIAAVIEPPAILIGANVATPGLDSTKDAVSPPAPDKTSRLFVPALTICLVAIAVAVFFVLRHRKLPLNAKDSLVLADFSNTTGDPVLMTHSGRECWCSWNSHLS